MALLSCVMDGWESISAVAVLPFKSLHLMLIHRMGRWSVTFVLSRIPCRLFLLILDYLLLFGVGLSLPLSIFVIAFLLLFYLLALLLLKLIIIVVSLISHIFGYGVSV